MKSFYLSWLLFFLVCSAGAQEKVQYTSLNYVGILEGEVNTAFQLQTIQGIKYRQWITGIGTGLDYYYIRSIPLFLSVNRTLLEKTRSPYLTLDGGLNFAWKRNDRSQWNGSISNTFTPTLFWAAGLGYKVSMGNKKDALLLNVGYSFKQLKEEQVHPRMCINPPCPNDIEYYDYKLNRVSVKVGWKL